ncbi:MAG: ABC transporter ATP-binding protein [Anaerolineae bacterium]
MRMGQDSPLAQPLLAIEELHTYFPLDEGLLKAVCGVSLQVHEGQVVGLIGESGCGKSVTAQSILRIVPPPGRICSGRILYYQDNGQVIDLAALPARGREMRAIRGNEIAMVFQEPMTSLSPVHTIGFQIMEALRIHQRLSKAAARQKTIDVLDRVGMPDPVRRIDSYPHELSGGLRQRAMIAMALSCTPRLLVADEPTTALDVTIQAQILDLLLRLQADTGMAVLYITHDLGVVAEICQRVAVMYLGRVVELAPVRELYHNPQHPYTRRLLKSMPRAGRGPRSRLDAIDGMVPVPINLPEQCGFRSRCREYDPSRGCREPLPPLVQVSADHWVRCWQAHEAMQ